jgi:hypothetical protein
MDMQAGAPPDDFAVKGQKLGFPDLQLEKNAGGCGLPGGKQRF